jgi:ribosomal protein S18 acetylase RimI-like enzyme
VTNTNSGAISSHIRRLDVQRDLLETADLIELCFGSQMDPDGHAYLRNIRRAARNNDHLRWLPGPNEQATYPLFGYVWEQDRRIIGNISLIPILYEGSWRYLIANVAVHPDYRGNGIGHQLTSRALRHVQDQRVRLACLQVRDTAPVAHHMYLSQGFHECARRSTWVTDPSQPFNIILDGSVRIAPRQTQDWPIQSEWLKKIYPEEVIWNLLYNHRRLAPNLWQRFLNLANGVQMKQWTALKDEGMAGALTWEPTRLYADNLWLAVDLNQDNQDIIAALLHTARKILSHTRPLSINFPADMAVEAFTNTGFHLQNTLIWMEKRF